MARRKERHKSPSHTQKTTLQKLRDRLPIARRLFRYKRRQYKLSDLDDGRYPIEDGILKTRMDRHLHDLEGRVVDPKYDLVLRNPIQVAKDKIYDIRSLPLTTRQFFENPLTTICERRKMRREIIFATRKTGKGAMQKIRHFTNLSNVFCRKHK